MELAVIIGRQRILNPLLTSHVKPMRSLSWVIIFYRRQKRFLLHLFLPFARVINTKWISNLNSCGQESPPPNVWTQPICFTATPQFTIVYNNNKIKYFTWRAFCHLIMEFYQKCQVKKTTSTAPAYYNGKWSTNDWINTKWYDSLYRMTSGTNVALTNFKWTNW